MRRLLIVVGILVAARIAAAPAPTPARDVRLTILYTGDLHGRAALRADRSSADAQCELGNGVALQRMVKSVSRRT